MARKMAMFCVVLLFLFMLVPAISGIVYAANEENSMQNDYLKQNETQKKESSKLINANNIISQDAIDKNKKSFDLQDNSKSSASADSTASIDDLGTGAYRIAWTILLEIQKLSFPVSAIIIIAGALLRHIIGPKNMAKRKSGRVMIIGGLTLFTLAQIVPFVFYIWMKQQ